MEFELSVLNEFAPKNLRNYIEQATRRCYMIIIVILIMKKIEINYEIKNAIFCIHHFLLW